MGGDVLFANMLVGIGALRVTVIALQMPLMSVGGEVFGTVKSVVNRENVTGLHSAGNRFEPVDGAEVDFAAAACR